MAYLRGSDRSSPMLNSIWYRENSCNGGICRGFVCQSASGGKGKDLIRLLAVEEVEMGF